MFSVEEMSTIYHCIDNTIIGQESGEFADFLDSMNSAERQEMKEMLDLLKSARAKIENANRRLS